MLYGSQGCIVKRLTFFLILKGYCVNIVRSYYNGICFLCVCVNRNQLSKISVYIFSVKKVSHRFLARKRDRKKKKKSLHVPIERGKINKCRCYYNQNYIATHILVNVSYTNKQPLYWVGSFKVLYSSCYVLFPFCFEAKENQEKY